jgi:hypothetical protein
MRCTITWEALHRTKLDLDHARQVITISRGLRRLGRLVVDRVKYTYLGIKPSFSLSLSHVIDCKSLRQKTLRALSASRYLHSPSQARNTQSKIGLCPNVGRASSVWGGDVSGKVAWCSGRRIPQFSAPGLETDPRAKVGAPQANGVLKNVINCIHVLVLYLVFTCARMPALPPGGRAGRTHGASCSGGTPVPGGSEAAPAARRHAFVPRGGDDGAPRVADSLPLGHSLRA